MEKEKLNWSALRGNKCPRCGGGIAAHPTASRFCCDDSGCAFSISKEAFERIVSDRNSKSLDRESVSNEPIDCTFCHSRHGANEMCAGFGV